MCLSSINSNGSHNISGQQWMCHSVFCINKYIIQAMSLTTYSQQANVSIDNVAVLMLHGLVLDNEQVIEKMYILKGKTTEMTTLLCCIKGRKITTKSACRRLNKIHHPQLQRKCP